MEYYIKHRVASETHINTGPGTWSIDGPFSKEDAELKWQYLKIYWREGVFL
jgi:hypothetical protein